MSSMNEKADDCKQSSDEQKPSPEHAEKLMANNGVSNGSKRTSSRHDDTERRAFPFHKTNYLSVATFHWITGFMWKSFKNDTISESEMWKVCPEESAQQNGERLHSLWQEEVRVKGLPNASIGRVVARFSRRLLLTATAINLVNAAFTFAGPAIIFRALLNYAKSSESNIVFGLAMAILLFACDIIRIATIMMQFYFGYLLSIRVRSALMYLIYNKLLKLRSLRDKSAGQLVNYFSNDCQRVHELMIHLPMAFGGPIFAVVSATYCVLYLGRWALLGAGIIALYYPYQFVISRLTTYVRRKSVVVTDSRIRKMTEILTCIRLIKLYAWEMSFAKAVSAIRAKEKAMLQKASYLQTLSIAFIPLTASLAAVCTFLGQVLSGNDLTVDQAFVCIAIYNVTRMKIAQLPFLVRIGSEALVAMKRAKAILVMDEINPNWFVGKPSDPRLAIEIREAVFAWDAVNQISDEKRGKPTEPHLGQRGHVKEKEQCEGTKREINGNTHQPLVVKTSATDKDVEAITNDVDDCDKPVDVLFDINLNIEKGKLIGICGCVGCGKSSLLSAILGQMILRRGTVTLNGKLSYVPQQAWILNATLKDNILFGMPFDEKKYQDVIEQCNLKADIRILPAADETEIGERGVTLSGGQKQRVSLARAVYSDADVYLLDDPLSAVDAHVGRHLYEHCLLRAARVEQKTVVLVTHQIQYLNQCDTIVVINDGCVVEAGAHDQLMAAAGHYAHLVNTYYVEQKQNNNENDVCGEDAADQSTTNETVDKSLLRQLSKSDAGSQLSVHRASSRAGRLIEEEKKEKGAVTLSAYWWYVRAAGGLLVAVVVILVFALPVTCMAFTDWWLSYWLTKRNVDENLSFPGNASTNSTTVLWEYQNDVFYAAIYGAAAIATIATLCLRGVLYMMATLRAASYMHDRAFTKIMCCPMSFFDVTPVGRLLNRFSKDVDEVDVRLPFNCEELLQNLFHVLLAVVMISIGFPWFLLSMVLPALLFFVLQRIANIVIRETKRIDNVSRSPLYGHIATTAQGLSSIRACHKQNDFMNLFQSYVDRNSAALLHFYFGMRWLAFRLDILTSSVTFVVAVVIATAKGYIQPSYAALALTYSAKLTGLLQYTTRLAAEAEARFTSVERMHSYLKNVEEEAPATLPHRPAPSWPDRGVIEYNSYCMRYRPTLPLILKNVTFRIESCEKIGVVGRTGSGKTSMVSALFRLVEPVSGGVVIDGVDISTIGLHDLRSKMSIIPQDPVLFMGSIRYNLDPFNERLDSDIWAALEKCHMKGTIAKLDRNLSAPVVENGENFSVGERQLLCLARALLRNSKILVLDEATAAVDTAMDAAIQATITEAFVNCTMLIIAHRLNTVQHCDKILVLDRGKVAEFDTPQNLLQNSNSLFADMLHRSELKVVDN